MTRSCFAAVVVVCAACGLPPSAPDPARDPNAGPADAPADVGGAPGVFVPVTDGAEQQRLADDLWRTLSAQECWESTDSFLQQYAFFGAFGFKYSGFDTNSGTIALQAIGRFNDRPAAVWSTWDTEFMTLTDGGFATQNQQTNVVTTYVPGTHGCL